MAEYRLTVDTKGSKTTVQLEGDARVIPVDYSNEGSIKQALTGVDVVISTISGTVTEIDVQRKIAAAANEAHVKLFVPSEFGGVSEGGTEGLYGAKAKIQGLLRALRLPYAVFYTGVFADFIWTPYVLIYLFLFRLVNHGSIGI
jgi:uncharacterized protein YbjT (DUF2867 family)